MSKKEKLKTIAAALSALLLWHCAEKGANPGDAAEERAPEGATGAVLPIPPSTPEDTRPLLLFSSNNSGNWEIYGLESLDGGLVNLTRHPGFDSAPAWSPDGSRIAFISDRNGRRALYVMDADGSGVRQLTDEPLRSADAPAWSPDGSRIAFKSRFQLFTEVKYVSPEGDGPVALTRFATEELGIGPLFWSPDGTRLALHVGKDRFTRSESYIVPGDGSLERRLLSDDAWPGSLAWAPDGSRVAFSEELADGNIEIYTAGADGGDRRNLSRHPGTDSDPAWAPDGSRIAFVSSRDGDAEIYVMDADGNNARNLSRSLEYEMAPQWSPDSRHIAYISLSDGAALRLMGSDGGNPRRLTRSAVNSYAWRPR